MRICIFKIDYASTKFSRSFFLSLNSKFQISVFGSIFAGLVVHGMDQTTSAPEVTTEDASGRLLALPNPEKCANRESAFSG
jgi:hypothetical protein